MSFGGFNDSPQSTPMAEINVTPMVDVMLVLLVIFILAAPLFTQAIQLELPKAAAAPAATLPATIRLSIDGAGKVYWNDAAVAADALPARMAQAAKQLPQPDLQLRSDRATRYEIIAQVMAAAQGNGLSKIGFVTDPLPTPAPVPPPASAAVGQPSAPTSFQLSPSITPAPGK